MKIANIFENVMRTAKVTGLKVKKASPEIMVIAGIGCGIGAAVMACKATLKVEEIITDVNDKMDMIKSTALDPTYSDRYSEEDAKKDKAILIGQTAVKLGKLYGPSIAVGVASIALICVGHNILRKRHVALVGAYCAVSDEFKNYRANVVKELGEAADKKFKYGLKLEEIEEKTTNDKGENVTEKKLVETFGNNWSPYAKFFDEYNPNWEKSADYNLLFLINQQNYCNNKLKAQGYLFLNDVYDCLGIDRTREGQIVGWIYDPKKSNGDSFIDFGIYNGYRKANRDFVNGAERSILLDFNVDGPIIDMI